MIFFPNRGIIPHSTRIGKFALVPSRERQRSEKKNATSILTSSRLRSWFAKKTLWLFSRCSATVRTVCHGGLRDDEASAKIETLVQGP